jgi:hypothetical protein
LAAPNQQHLVGKSENLCGAERESCLTKRLLARKPKLILKNLSHSTGFPPQTLTDFAQRVLLPGETEKHGGERTFDGLALLRRVVEIEDAE